MRKKITNLIIFASGNVFIRGGTLMTISSFAGGFLNYLFNLLVGRSLGPEGYGEITAMFSYWVILSIPIGVIGGLLIQKIGSSEYPEQYALGLYSWFLQKLKKWRFLFVLILLTTPFIPWLTNLSWGPAISLPILMILSIGGTFYGGAFQGLHLFAWFSAISIFSTLLKLAGPILVVFHVGGLNTVLLFIVLASSIPLVINHLVLKKRFEKISGKPTVISKRILDIFKDRQMWLTTGSTSILALLNNVDIIYAKRMFSAEDAGIYSSWSLFAKIIFFVFGPLLATSYIFFSSKKEELKHQFVFIGCLVLFAVVGVVTNVSYGLYGKQIIRLLFGFKFFPVLPFLEWASLFGSAYLIMMFITQYYLAKKSKLSLLPGFLFPFYLVGLFVFPKSISDLMLLNIGYAFVVVAIFLLFFFKERIVYLLKK